MRFFRSIKFRLTIRYLAVIMVLLLAFGTTAYFLLSRNLYQALDDSLKQRVSSISASIEFDDGTVKYSGAPGELTSVYGAGGQLLSKYGPIESLQGISDMVSRALLGRDSFKTSRTADGQGVRLYAAPDDLTTNTRVAIVVGDLIGDIQDELAAFRLVLAYSTLAVLFLAALGGFVMAGRVLKPIEKITSTAREIGGSALNRRILVNADDELGRLASTLNDMIGRIEAAFERQKQFTADASHELRTPLSIIQAESTLALEKDRPAEEYRKSLELVSLEVRYMSAIIEKLLLLARSDSGQHILQDVEPLDLRTLLDDIEPDMRLLAEEKGLVFSLEMPVDVFVMGDRVKLRQLFINLIQNAITYTGRGGAVEVRLSKHKKKAEVVVADTGIGISEANLDKIFQRFYRIDKSRSRAAGGTGLGLSISKHIAEAHGGSIEVTSELGKGSQFRVTIPVITPR